MRLYEGRLDKNGSIIFDTKNGLKLTIETDYPDQYIQIRLGSFLISEGVGEARDVLSQDLLDEIHSNEFKNKEDQTKLNKLIMKKKEGLKYSQEEIEKLTDAIKVREMKILQKYETVKKIKEGI